MRPWSVLACSLLLLALPLLPAAQGVSAGGAAAGWRETLVIDSGLAGPRKMFEAFDTASLNLYDFNGDGQLEIVSNNDNNHAYVIDSRTGRVLAELETYHYNNPRWPVRELNPIAIGELYGDGRPCMVIPNSAAFMSAWCYDAGASTAESFQFEKMWEIKVDAAKYEPGFQESHPWLYHPNGTLREQYSLGLDGNAYLADVDGDRRMEIFVETDGYPGQLAFNADGEYLWSKSFWDGNAGAKVADIDGDGVKEAVFASDAGVIASYNARNGAIEWVFESSKRGAWPGSVPVPPLVADLHGDGKHEVVFGTRNVVPDQSDPNWINESHARYFALDHKGRILWNASYDWMNPLQYNHPAAADVNEDGVLDVVVLDWNTVGHKPGNWNTTNRRSNLFALDGRDGSVLWHVGVPVYWSNKDFVIADVTGDGKMEIVTVSSKEGQEGLAVHALKDGKEMGFWPVDWAPSRGPVAGDLYGDGKLYLVVPVMRKIYDQPNYRSLDVGYREGALRVIATGAAWDVEFSANILHNDEQARHEPKGSSGTPPPTPTTPETTDPVPTTPPTPTTPSPDVATTPSGGTTPPPSTPEEEPPVEPTESNLLVPGPAAAVALAAVAAVAVLRRRS